MTNTAVARVLSVAVLVVGLAGLSRPCQAVTERAVVIDSGSGIGVGTCKACYGSSQPGIPGTCINSSKSTGVFCPPCPATSTCGIALAGSATFTVAQDHLIIGRVLDDDEEGVASFTVTAHLPTSQTLSTTTDEDGYWSSLIDTASTTVVTHDLGDVFYVSGVSSVNYLDVVVFKCPSGALCD